jgi:hypothetical protein
VELHRLPSAPPAALLARSPHTPAPTTLLEPPVHSLSPVPSHRIAPDRMPDRSHVSAARVATRPSPSSNTANLTPRHLRLPRPPHFPRSACTRQMGVVRAPRHKLPHPVPCPSTRHSSAQFRLRLRLRYRRATRRLRASPHASGPGLKTVTAPRTRIHTTSTHPHITWAMGTESAPRPSRTRF